MGQPAARVGDMHICPMFDGPKPHVGGPVLPPGKLTVLIGGMPAATITDRCVCASVPDIIMQGAQTVLINGLMAARMGDGTVHGGRIVVGCPTVLIGGPTFTTPSFFAKFFNTFLDNLKFNAGLVVGFGEGLLSTVESLINVLIHPIDTIKGIFKLADSIISSLAKKETWIALTQKETWVKINDSLGKIYDDFERASPYEKGKVVGHAVEFVAELLVPITKAKLATEAAEAARVAEATRVAAGLTEVAELTKGLGKIEGVTIGRFTPLNPGPLPENIAKTFRSATYVEKIAEKDIKLYRYWGGKSNEFGRFWTTTTSESFTSQLDGAILPEWGNTFENVTEITIPKGTVYYEGKAASQQGKFGGLGGGGNQVFLPEIDLKWQTTRL